VSVCVSAATDQSTGTRARPRAAEQASRPARRYAVSSLRSAARGEGYAGASASGL